MNSKIDELRVNRLGKATVRADGDYVLYWMVAARRTRSSHALQHARWWAEQLGKPLLVLEALRADYRWVSERHHTFVLQGMHDNAAAFECAGVRYLSYVEPDAGAGRGLVEALAARASVVVTDDSPAFFLRRMVEAVGPRLGVLTERVDGIGLVPLRLPQRGFTVAHSLRRWIQKNVHRVLHDPPLIEPLDGYSGGCAEVPAAVLARWSFAEVPADVGPLVATLSLPSLSPSPERGGPVAAAAAWRHFLDQGLDRYLDDRQSLENTAQTHLSGHLHYGHISTHEMLSDLVLREDWSPERLSKPNGKRHGFWGMSEPTEAFLDELVTWREIGHLLAHREPRYREYDTLPSWALQTLEEHRADARPGVYDLEAFDAAETHDDVWNAAQRELVATGRIHNAMRMVWGKGVLSWSESPEHALQILIELNNRYAIDGRDPNSYSGIFWVFGRFDRAWGPEREVFGKVRYMTTAAAMRKLKARAYVKRWAGLHSEPRLF